MLPRVKRERLPDKGVLPELYIAVALAHLAPKVIRVASE
jgi:hypothetical protein